MDVCNMSNGQLLDVLQWSEDRAAYYRACGRPMPGTAYADSERACMACIGELYRRGYKPHRAQPQHGFFKLCV